MSANEQHPTEALAAYAFGAAAVEPRELIALESHLATCAECRAGLAELRRVVTGVGLDVPLEAPPTRLRQRIVNAANAANAANDVPSSPAQSLQTRQSQQWRHSPVLPWFLAAASVVLAVASTMYAWNASERARAFSEGAAALQRNLNTLQGSMNVLRARLDIMAAPDVISVNLAGQPEAPAAHARAFMSKTHGMVLTADHLPALAGGRTYQLWVVTKAAPVSVGVFDVNKDGSAVGVMPIAAGATEDPVAVAVTIEPAGGVAAPTGPRVLVGAVEAK